MSDGVLPHTVNTRKAVGREARYIGTLGAAQVPVFSACLEPDNPQALHADIRFGRDEEDRPIVHVALRATVRLECQRCLGWFLRELRSDSRLALVPSDEHAKHLPEDYEPLLTDEETDLWAVVSEELALALPVVAYHPEGECSLAVTGTEEQEPEVDDAERSNPFDVLSALLNKPAADSDEE